MDDALQTIVDVAFGVLIDAFFIRMTLVPAVLTLLGRTAWALPPPLERRLPKPNIEGDRLHDQLAQPARSV